jgi:hypothetical protein
MLAPRVPPPRRRCVFCVRAIRRNFDCFGRPFFTPPRFTMPRSHPDDSKAKIHSSTEPPGSYYSSP